MKKTLTLGLLITLLFSLSACKDNGEIEFILVGNEEQNYTIDEFYTEQGFLALEGTKDLSEYVTMTNNIDPTTSGNYNVEYTLAYEDNIKVITRDVYYREQGCFVVTETTTTKCNISFSQYLNTYITLTVYYDSANMNSEMGTVFTEVENILSDYHELANKYDAFEGVVNVKTINDDPTTTHILDERLFDMIEFSLDHQDEVNNLFNIALGPVLQVWHDYRENCNTISYCAVPELSELQVPDQYTNPDDIILNSTNKSITMSENMSIDLGGISKGYISNVINEYLNTLDIDGYLFNNGQSNISVGGIHPLRDHEKYILATSDPERASSIDYPGFITIRLGDNDQLVTSGDNQQFYMVGDVLYHHIINPNTLYPERFSRTVSIIINGDAGLADLYSTAIFTMSMEDGLAFVNSKDEIEAVWYELDGTITYSTGFEDKYLETVYKTD